MCNFIGIQVQMQLRHNIIDVIDKKSRSTWNSPESCYPAVLKIQPTVMVKMILIKYHLDVDSLFQKQFSLSFDLLHYCCLFPFDGLLTSPTSLSPHASQCVSSTWLGKCTLCSKIIQLCYPAILWFFSNYAPISTYYAPINSELLPQPWSVIYVYLQSSDSTSQHN